MNRLINKLLEPFSNHLTFFVLIFILICSVDIFYQSSIENFKYSIYLIAHGFIESYILSLGCSIMSRRIANFLKVTILLLAFFFFCLNIYCYITYHSTGLNDILAILLGTNLLEATEFLSVCIPFSLFVIVLLLLSIIIISYTYFNRKESIFKHKYISLPILAICLTLAIHNPAPWKDLLLGELLEAYKASNTPELSTNLKPNEVKVISRQPKNIVFILGESFCKTHSSLYGYLKPTNPLLSKIEKDSLLTVFTNVRSSALNTIESFKLMMSTYRKTYGDSCKWYDCINLPEIIKYSNYKSIWISNQSKNGAFDNIVGKYADLCNENHFVGDKNAGLRRNTYDEEIIKILQNQSQNDSLQFYFLHLMGSHYQFNKRYPQNFNKFVENEYKEFPIKQRFNLASYDNSVLYNDYVVNEIIKLFQGEEAIIFYFSDHAIDLYDSSENYVGHAKLNNPISMEAGYRIPFMIYCSPSFQKTFPNIMKKIKANTNQPYETENILYTAMDIMGVTFVNNNDVEKYSLLK